ncbi:hypothetical protein SLS56_008200 [Neofusicoccum ribis]|uniref:F-box domain-containing protein n=1 Tax=Neofusicoccum ribis TaxID=45134 RepID=A0ABR3SKQ7_9PEZI
MRNLPYDIIFLIVDELERLTREENSRQRVRLASYATINKTWKVAVERVTFRNIFVHPRNIHGFKEIFGRDRARLSAVRSLRYIMNHHLNTTNDDSIEPEGSCGDEGFSRSLEEMFELLADWESGDSPNMRLQDLCLNLGIQHNRAKQCEYESRESDYRENRVESNDHDSENDESSEEDQDSEDGQDSHGDNYWKVVEQRAEQLRLFEGKSLRPEALMEILSSMDGLQECYLNAFSDATTKDPSLRPEYRKGFYHRSQGMDAQPGVFDSGIDHLSIGLRYFSTILENLHLEDVRISPSLFWPQEDEPSSDPPYWPNLRHMKVEFAEVSALDPSDLPEIEDFNSWDKPESIYRERLDHNRLRSLYVAMAKAVRQMPALKELEMVFPDFSSTYIHFGVIEKRDAREVFWDAWEKVELDQEVLEALGVTEDQLEVTEEGTHNYHLHYMQPFPILSLPAHF